MTRKSFNDIYENVPSDQKDRLQTFRSTHPYVTLDREDVTWEYISCGKGEEPLVLLPGGIRFAETWFRLITILENEYSIISPTYPPLPTMADMTEGIFHILTSESSKKVHLLGTSFGGWVAQCFVRHYPDKVQSLILSHTSGPSGISKNLVRFGQVVTDLCPLQLIRNSFRQRLMNLLSIPDSDHQFWKAFLTEMSLRMTKDDIKAQQACTVDFVTNYAPSQDGSVMWPGRILIIESDDDPAFKNPVRENLKTLYPRAQVHTFHNSGHTPGYSNPQEYAKVIKDFLNEFG
ncbi:MAG: alpha/beta hydrolase [Theionarchaea archaeon]|nr:alpha/beta hydrolase [Theionarchaea archaeon]